MNIIDSAERPTLFLTAAGVPLHELTLRTGDRVRVKLNRRVIRVGYRKVPGDYHEEVEAKLRGTSALTDLARHLGIQTLRAGRSFHKLVDALAYAVCTADHFGGRDRGVLLSLRSNMATDAEYTVDHVRHVRLGTYYAPTWDSEDYESGGLHGLRVVTICTIAAHEYLAGDLELIQPAPRKRKA